SDVIAGRWSAGVIALAAGVLCALCLWTATMPELLCRTSLQTGDWEWEHRRAEAAQTRYLAAADADRWAIEPVERLSELAFQRWQQSRRDDDFDVAIGRLQTVQQRLPFASRPLRRIGQMWLSRFTISRDLLHARLSASAFA